MSALEIVLAAVLAGASVALVVQQRRLRRAHRTIARLEREQREAAHVERRRPPRALRTAGKAVQVVADTAALVRDHGVGTLVASSIEDLTRWAADARADIDRLTAADGTVTIFFSDVEGSTALNERLGDAEFVKVLAQHDTVVRRAIDAHRGTVVKSQGDGFMVVFRDARDAVAAAVALQDRLGEAKGRLRSHGIRVRIGLHRGVAVARDGDWFGRNVAYAARVASIADGGEVLVSDELRSALVDATEFVFGEPREAELKGFRGPQQLWPVDAVRTVA